MNTLITLILLLFKSFFLSPLILPSSTKFKYPQIFTSYTIFLLWIINAVQIFWQFWEYQLFLVNFTSIVVILLISIAHTLAMFESWTYRDEHIEIMQTFAELNDICEMHIRNFQHINNNRMKKCFIKVWLSFSIIVACQIIGMSLGVVHK